VAAWPAVALVGSYELLMIIIRAAQLPRAGTALGGAPERMPDTDPLQVQAAQAFAGELAAGCVPSVRAIRDRLHVGHVPSGYAHTWPRSTARRPARPSNIRLRSLRSVGCLTGPPTGSAKYPPIWRSGLPPDAGDRGAQIWQLCGVVP
jgi:hypothetical protein